MSISVVVPNGGSHSGLLASILVKGGARGDRHIGKSAVMIVVVKNARSTIAGDEDVGPAVLVEVESGHTERVMSVGLVDVSLSGHVFKCAVAAVVIENVLGSSQSARTTHHGNPLPDAGGSIAWRRRSSQIEIHVICDYQVEAAVAIVIHECTSCTPGLTRSRNGAFRSDFREDAMIVVVEPVLAVV